VAFEVAEAAGEVHQWSRVCGQSEAAYVADDDPVVARGVLGREVALDRGEGLGSVSGSAKRSPTGAAARRAKPPCRAPRM
jgi:hypothetical protein